MLSSVTQFFKQKAFALAGHLGRCDVRDTVVVAGAPRSGTTWLMEIMREMPGYKALAEPLRTPEAVRDYGFEARTLLSPKAAAPHKQAYISKVLAGQVGYNAGWYSRQSSRIRWLLEHARRNKLIVKFCQAGRMLQWIDAHFSTRGMILIVRHPCARIASALTHPGIKAWSQTLRKNPLQKILNHGYLPPALREKVHEVAPLVRSPSEVLAVKWCLDYYVPFYHFAEAGYPWLLVSYERLVTSGQAELERISEHVETDLLVRASSYRLAVPSVTVKDPVRENPDQQLAKWKDVLDPDTAARILHIAEAFDLDFYSDALHPDYSALMRFDGASNASAIR